MLNYDVIKYGTAICKIADERPRRTHICIERVLPWELLCNPDDALYGRPQCLYQVRRADRLVVQETWPEFADKLAHGGQDFASTNMKEAIFSADQTDVVMIVEAWRLPQGDYGGGRHTIVCGDVTLLDEEWDRQSFPFEFLYRQQPGEGIWGMSLSQELSGIQLAINKLARDIQRAQNLVVGHYLIENSTEINTGSINDRIGGFIRYRGTKPEYYAPPPVSDQNINYMGQLWQRGFETIGISQQTAQSQKPPGLDSGKALMVYADIQSQRFKPSYEEYQHFFLRLGRQIIETARGMDESFYVKAAGKQTMSVVSWADAGGLDDSEFALKLYPTNALADDPSARFQQVQNLMSANLIDPKAGRRLLDMPDLEEFSSYENASYNLTMKIMGQILDGKEYIGPEPYMDLAEGIKLMQLGYLKGRLEDVPEDRLQLISTWISQAEGLLNPQPEAPPPVAPGMPQQPGELTPPGMTPGPEGPLPTAQGIPPGGPLAPAKHMAPVQRATGLA
jgi:hypothetical protein